jgi:hypothetical protein
MTILSKEQLIVDLVLEELEKAEEEFPEFNSPHEGYAILKEEVDELWDCIKANHGDEMLEECVQVAAMAFRYIKDVCRLDT